MDGRTGRRAERVFRAVTLGEGARRRHRELLSRRMTEGALEDRGRRTGELAVIVAVLVAVLAVTIWQYAASRPADEVATVPNEIATSVAGDVADSGLSAEPAESVRAGELSLDAGGRSRRVLQLVIPSPAPTEGTVAALADQAGRYLDETGADVVAVLAWRDEGEVGNPDLIIGRAYVSSDGEGWGEPDEVHNTFQDDPGGILVELYLWPDGRLSPDGRLTSVRVVPKPE
jgi:hypothetical protein